MKKKSWSDASILQSIKNPESQGYEIKHRCPELTFMGAGNQPDFAELFITFYPDKKVVELKSLKQYLFQFRTGTILSYERIINSVYRDMMEVYEPARLRLVMKTRPRGGISSMLTVDSDWKCRGGDESFEDWKGQPDVWE